MSKWNNGNSINDFRSMLYKNVKKNQNIKRIKNDYIDGIKSIEKTCVVVSKEYEFALIDLLPTLHELITHFNCLDEIALNKLEKLYLGLNSRTMEIIEYK